MVLSEKIYRLLLWLFPPGFRRTFGEQVLQLARDLGRDTGPASPRRTLHLCLSLVKDAGGSAARLYWEELMEKNRINPAPWGTVLLAILPSLLAVLSRSTIGSFEWLVLAFSWSVVALLLVGIPLTWGRTRVFPAWGLFPAGLLIWIGVYIVGMFFSEQLRIFNSLGPLWSGAPTGMFLLQLIVTVLLFTVFFRNRRVPPIALLVAAAIFLLNLAAAVSYNLDRPMSGGLLLGSLQYFFVAGVGPLEGFMLVAAGLFALRQHRLWALLVVVGGFAYMCMDSDYLSGFFLRDWSGYNLYLLAMTALYWLVPPLALLRARTRLGSALAVFIPVGLFHLARNAVPLLVTSSPHMIPWGDILLSVNVMLSLALAWVLYNGLIEEQPAAEIAFQR